LTRYIHRQPDTLAKAKENISRALWLFKLKKCPPLPVHYLCLVDEIISGSRAALWGLMWEIIQVYPPQQGAPGNIGQLAFGDKATAKHTAQSVVPYPQPGVGGNVPQQGERLALPYSAHQRRQLDLSLVQWLQEAGLLRDIVGGLAIPNTILALEGPVRDGTLIW